MSISRECQSPEDDIYRKKLHYVKLVKEMRPIKIPKFPVFRGKKAIKVLRYIANELEGQRCEELTEKQVAALIKITKGLISSIELEMCAKDIPRRFKFMNKKSDIPILEPRLEL
jgi:hypothetical protein